MLSEIDYWSQTLSPDKAAARITEHTRAILGVNVVVFLLQGLLGEPRLPLLHLVLLVRDVLLVGDAQRARPQRRQGEARAREIAAQEDRGAVGVEGLGLGDPGVFGNAVRPDFELVGEGDGGPSRVLTSTECVATSSEPVLIKGTVKSGGSSSDWTATRTGGAATAGR